MSDSELFNSIEKHKIWQAGFDAGVKAGREESRDWTPCAEGLPEESGRYRVTVERFFNGKASRFVSDREFFKYLSAGSRWESCVISENVLAWKPEDKPYNPDHIRDTTKKVDHIVDDSYKT